MIKHFTFRAAASALFLLVYSAVSFPQVSEGGLPYSFTHSLQSSTEPVIMASVDVDKLLVEDKLEEGKGVPLRFGYAFDVNYDLNNSGTWEKMPDGSRVWRLNILSPGAFTINLMYNDFWIPKGAKFFIYNENKTEVIGAFTNRNNKPDGQFSTGLVRGESVVLEYYEPAAVESPGIISVSKVIHGYKDLFKTISSIKDYGGSESCEININCPVGTPWKNEKRGVGLLLLADNTRFCSGSLINNVRQDFKPYFLTANHCGEGEDPTNWITMFNYESPDCSNINGPLNYTVHGATLRASNSASDFYLIELKEAPPDSYKVHYAGFNAINIPASSGVVIHHPSSDIKKISFFDVPAEDDATYYPQIPGSHWKITWHSDGSGGVTEPGSSGAPLLDQNHRIIGQLHGGPSSCTSNDKSDSFGKFSMSWDYGSTAATRLKDWLDPDNTGTRIVDGWDISMGTPDTVAPAIINDLAVTGVTSNSVSIAWTVPLDTTIGGVKNYDVRYSTNPITDIASFNSAAAVTFSGLIGSTGTPESISINGLQFSSKYYFAIVSSDRWNNKSELSNIITATTWFAPQISIKPDSLYHVIAGSSTYTDSIIISNVSSRLSTLDYSVNLANNTFPQAKISVQLVPLKSSQDNQKSLSKGIISESYGQSIKAKGGPDSFGYKWIDSDDPNGPKYVWDDISSTGTQITNWTSAASSNPRDDGVAGPFQLGFDFKFYGNVKKQISVSTNGLILFDYSTSAVFTNYAIPTAAVPNNFIAPFWDDLDGSSQGSVYYKQSGDKFIVQFTNWQRYTSSGPSGSITFQVILNSSGSIYIYYKNLTGIVTNDCTIGIENSTGTSGLNVCFNSTYLHDLLALKFSAEPDWLITNNAEGTLSNNNSAVLKMILRSEDFIYGDYRMNVVITSNDPLVPEKIIPVVMTIADVPVELVSFSAEPVKDYINLKWETATELNNSGFSVERKSLSDKTGWQNISFIKGAVNSSEKKQYSYCDKNISVGKYSYRLRQEDLDGTIKYSPVVEAEVKAPTKFELMQNYPNPFNPETRIKFSLPEKSSVRLTVYNMLGETAAELVNGTLDAGYHEVLFYSAKFSSGIYVYKLEAGNYSTTRKMLILK